MIDIVSAENGQDLGVYDTQQGKAANILSVQVYSLEYIPTFGIDIKYFLSEDFNFQNESFRAYIVETLANNGINVAEVTEQIRALDSVFNIKISPESTSSGFIAR